MLRGSGLGKIGVLRTLRDTIYRSVRPTRSLVITVNGFRMEVDPLVGDVVQGLLCDGVYERAETELIQSVLGEGDVFLDVGGNIGYYTLLASGLVGKTGRVVVFEPESTNLCRLRRNVVINCCSNVTIEGNALSDIEGDVSLCLVENHAGAHYIGESEDNTNRQSIHAIVFDKCERYKDLIVDVVKIDIEGHEFHALLGMINMIQRSPSIKIISEFSPAMIRRAGNDPEEYLNLIRSLGFKICIIEDSGDRVLHPENRSIMECAMKRTLINIYCER